MLLRHEGFRRLCAARDLLRDTSDDALPVAAVARQVGLSPFHFIRQFAAMFGTTPHRFRTDARLERARHLLAQGESVTDVCMEVGFSSLGSFSVLFARRMGESPSRFQRRIRALEPTEGTVPAALTPGCLTLMGRLPGAALRNSREA